MKESSQRWTIGTLVSMGTLIGMGVVGFNYFQTDDEADEAHAAISVASTAGDIQLAGDSERGRLENELKIVQLEINFLINAKGQRSLTPEQDDRLEYLRVVRVNLETRLRTLAGFKAV
jgi:hypothetical protein